jgi:hypothetical protein
LTAPDIGTTSGQPHGNRTDRSAVQPFTRAARRGLLPKLPQQFNDPDEATTKAAAIAGRYAGVVAYTMDVDEDRGEYSDPRNLLKIGDVPDF